MPNYKVLSPVKSGGKLHKIGEAVEMTETDAKQLLDAKIISDGKAGSDDGAKSLTEDEIITSIKDVIPNLAEGDFTQAGNPKVTAIENLLNGVVTAEEITSGLVADAWDKYQAEQQKVNA